MSQDKQGEDKLTYRERADKELASRLDSLYEFFADGDTHATDVADTIAATQDTLAEIRIDDLLARFNIDRSAWEALMRPVDKSKLLRDRTDKNIHAGHRERLRAAARRDKDMNGFRDTELIEILLSFLIPRRDTNPLAHKLIEKYGSVLGVLRAPAAELVQVPGMTSGAAHILPLLAAVCLLQNKNSVFIRNHFDAVDYFGSVYLGSAARGTYIACIDNSGRLAGIERSDGAEIVGSRAIVGTAKKYNTRNVLLVRREKAIFPDAFALNRQVHNVTVALNAMNVRLLDFIMFTDYGYYTLGQPPKKAGWYPQYIFVPLKKYASAPELIDAVADGGKLAPDENDGILQYAGLCDAEENPFIVTQLYELGKTK